MVLVIVHELGHMVAAKACGMRVERFKIFFGPTVARFGSGETSYELGVLPLGGYVKISGMTREEDLPADVVPRAYYSAAPWKRIVTIAAGPLVNIVLALVIFVVHFWVGPLYVETAPTNRVAAVTQGSPAAKAELRKGDRFVAVNDVRATGADAKDISALRTELRKNAGAEVTVVYERAGTEFTRRVRLTSATETDPSTKQVVTVGRLGFSFAERETRRYVERSSFAGGFADAWSFTELIVVENVKGIGRAFTSQQAREEISSVVGVAAVSNDIAENLGWRTQIRFAGIISLILGIFNLLPLFPLDGGHILFTLIEKVRRKPFGRLAYERAGMVGFALIAVLAIYAVNNDIGRLLGDGFPTTAR